MQLTKTKTLKAELPIVNDFLKRDAETTEHEMIYLGDISFEQEEDNIVLKTPDIQAYVERDYTVPQLLGRLNFGYGRAFEALPYTSTQVNVLNDLVRRKMLDKPKEKWYVPISNLKQGRPTVKAFLSNQYSYVSTYKLNLAIEDAIKDEGLDIQAVECYTSFTKTQIRYVDEAVAHIVNPTEVIQEYDDVIHGGFELTNSETGHSAVRVMLMTYRALCRNMAVFGNSREDVTDRFIHRGITHDKVKREVIEIVTNLEERFKELKPLMDKSATMITPIAYKTANNTLRIWSKSPHTTFELLLKDKVCRETIDTVITAYSIEKGNTLWHSLNALNYANALRDVPTVDELTLQELFGTLLMELRDITIVEWSQVAEKIKPIVEQTERQRDNHLIEELLGD